MENVKVVLVKSLIGSKPNQKATAKSLGLNKIGDYKIVEKDASIEGKINVICHLVKVEDAE